MATKTYRLSPMFCNDHWSRDCGQTDKTVKEGKFCVYVELDADGYADMLSDAELYSDHTHFDPPEEFYKLAQSAKRVAAILRKEGPPAEVPPTPEPSEAKRLKFGWCLPGVDAAHHACPATTHVHATNETHVCSCECHTEEGEGLEW